MNKKSLLLSLLISIISLTVNAQSIALSDGNVIYNVDTIVFGQIKDVNNNLIGQVDNAGIIYDQAQVQIASYSATNDLVASTGTTLGKINPDGSIENNLGELIGHILPSGEVMDANNNLIAIAPGVSDRILTYLFFFYPL